MRIVSSLLLLVLALAAPASVRAEPMDFTEKLEIGISTDEISITSDFRGADLTIFGAINGFNGNLLAQGKYNIVVALEGPKENTTVRKKERVFGIWINTSAMTFELVPDPIPCRARDTSTRSPRPPR